MGITEAVDEGDLFLFRSFSQKKSFKCTRQVTEATKLKGVFKSVKCKRELEHSRCEDEVDQWWVLEA